MRQRWRKCAIIILLCHIGELWLAQPCCENHFGEIPYIKQKIIVVTDKSQKRSICRGSWPTNYCSIPFSPFSLMSFLQTNVFSYKMSIFLSLVARQVVWVFYNRDTVTDTARRIRQNEATVFGRGHTRVSGVALPCHVAPRTPSSRRLAPTECQVDPWSQRIFQKFFFGTWCGEKKISDVYTVALF